MPRYIRVNSQAIDIQDTFFNVRGIVSAAQSIKPTIPKTMEQVPCSVTVFIISENVSI